MNHNRKEASRQQQSHKCQGCHKHDFQSQGPSDYSSVSQESVNRQLQLATGITVILDTDDVTYHLMFMIPSLFLVDSECNVVVYRKKFPSAGGQTTHSRLKQDAEESTESPQSASWFTNVVLKVM